MYLYQQLLQHYFNNFIYVIFIKEATNERLQKEKKDYIAFTNCLGIPRNEKKDAQGTVCLFLRTIINTNLFKARLPTKKLAYVITIIAYAVFQSSLNLKFIRSLIGYLIFYFRVITLKCMFIKYIQTFVISFLLSARYYFKQKIFTIILRDLT